jgi:hypothetical protein
MLTWFLVIDDGKALQSVKWYEHIFMVTHGMGLLRSCYVEVTSLPTRRITRWAEHNQYEAALGQDICYPYALISRIRPTGLFAA